MVDNVYSRIAKGEKPSFAFLEQLLSARDASKEWVTEGAVVASEFGLPIALKLPRFRGQVKT